MQEAEDMVGWTCKTVSCPVFSWSWEQTKAEFYVVNIEIRPEITSAVPNSNKSPDITPHDRSLYSTSWKGEDEVERQSGGGVEGTVENKVEGGEFSYLKDDGIHLRIFQAPTHKVYSQNSASFQVHRTHSGRSLGHPFQ